MACSSAERLRRRLRAFWPDKGFGFVACGKIETDVFVHANSFVGPQPLACGGSPDSDPFGQEVEFTLDARNPNRLRGIEAAVVGDALDPTEEPRGGGGYG